jgi:hypothetical protein
MTLVLLKRFGAQVIGMKAKNSFKPTPLRGSA